MKELKMVFFDKKKLELGSKELNHSAFACFCWGFDFYEVKKILLFLKKEKGNTFTL